MQVNVVATDGTPVTTFSAPLIVHLSSVTPGFQPAYSHDGVKWTFIPRLSSPSLPAGQLDGYYRNADGSIDIYTLHATFYGVVEDVAPPSRVLHLGARVYKGHLRLHWTGSHDNVALGRYVVRLYRSGLRAAHTTQATLVLRPGTYYVVAVDNSGNVGNPSPEAIVSRTKSTTRPWKIAVVPRG